MQSYAYARSPRSGPASRHASPLVQRWSAAAGTSFECCDAPRGPSTNKRCRGRFVPWPTRSSCRVTMPCCLTRALPSVGLRHPADSPENCSTSWFATATPTPSEPQSSCASPCSPPPGLRWVNATAPSSTTPTMSPKSASGGACGTNSSDTTATRPYGPRTGRRFRRCGMNHAIDRCLSHGGAFGHQRHSARP